MWSRDPTFRSDNNLQLQGKTRREQCEWSWIFARNVKASGWVIILNPFHEIAGRENQSPWIVVSAPCIIQVMWRRSWIELRTSRGRGTCYGGCLFIWPRCSTGSHLASLLCECCNDPWPLENGRLSNKRMFLLLLLPLNSNWPFHPTALSNQSARGELTPD